MCCMRHAAPPCTSARLRNLTRSLELRCENSTRSQGLGCRSHAIGAPSSNPGNAVETAKQANCCCICTGDESVRLQISMYVSYLSSTLGKGSPGGGRGVLLEESKGL